MNMDMCSRYLGTLQTAAALCFCLGCSDKNPTAVVSDVVTDPYPLKLGNYWDYSLTQRIYIEAEDSLPPWSLSSTGSQRVSISRTEAITGEEAFGVRHHHVMGYMMDPMKADTTVEIHYMAPRGDRIVLKGIQFGYNTGGFIPFGLSEGVEGLVTRIGDAGSGRYVPLTKLARQLLSPVPMVSLSSGLDALLASDGLINRDDFLAYENDYLLVFNELYKGRQWVSLKAGGVGGMEISQKVTNILPSLSGFEGPIAEVEMYNTYVEATSSDQYKIRYYYKSGVGIIQAEISDPEFPIGLMMPDGQILDLRIGLWEVVKKLTDYQVQ